MFNQTDHLWGTSRASDGPKIMARGEGGEKLGEGRCFGEFFEQVYCPATVLF